MDSNSLFLIRLVVSLAIKIVSYLQWRSQDFSMGGGGGAPSAGQFCNFLIKITHFYAFFGQNSYLKIITHQLKA